MRWTLVAMLLTGCFGAARPPCNLKSELQIDTEYLNEARKACYGYSYDTCPYLTEIRAKYRAMRLEAAKCSR